MWVQYRPIISIVARMARQKIPEELDAVLTAVAGGDPNAVANLQSMAVGQQGQLGEMEVPEPRIGERVLTQDLIDRAYFLYYKQGLSYREIANFFTEKLGVPVSHATIANYIYERNQDLEESRHNTRNTAIKVSLFAGITAFLGFLLAHFLRF